jgi:hypothetical protein
VVTALEEVELLAEVDRLVRGEDLDLVDLLAAEAIEHLFGELVAFLDEEFGFGALTFGAGLLRLGLRGVGGGLLSGKRDGFGDDRADDLAVTAFLALGEVEFADAEASAPVSRPCSPHSRSNPGSSSSARC